VKGMKIHKQEENYTTQQCPCCGRRKKPSGINYICKILSKYKYKKITYIEDIKETKYLRVA